MGHQPFAKQSVPLTGFGGLTTFADPQDLPEKASPWCEDMDFRVGSVLTRAGEKSVFTFSGETLGPSGGGLAVNVPIGGAAWASPGSVVLNDGTFASVSVGGNGSSLLGAISGADEGGSFPWTNPNNIGSTSVFATVPLIFNSPSPPPSPPPITPPGPPFTPRPPTRGPVLELDPVDSNFLLAGFNFALPPGAAVVGVILSLKASATADGNVASFALSMLSGGVSVGNAVSQNINTTPTTYTFGSALNPLGTAFTSTDVNGTNFQVVLQAILTGTPPFNSTFSFNSLSATMFYTLPNFADPIKVTEFGFAAVSSSGIIGIQVGVDGFQTGTGDLLIQLMKNGVPTGTSKKLTQNATESTLFVGGNNDLWDTTWDFNDVNNIQFGVQVSTEDTATQNIDFISVQIFQTAALENFNYVKTFAQSKGTIFDLALDNAGVLWSCDVVNTPGVLSSILEGIIPGSFMQSITLDDYEYMFFSDRNSGTDIPRQYSGTWFDRISQEGPGAPPTFQASLSAVAQVTITAWSITSNVVTFTATNAFTAGEVVTISGLSSGSFFNGLAFSILGTGLSTSQFQVAFVHANASATETGLATPQYGYIIAASNGITQPPAKSDPKLTGFLQQLLWSSGPGTTASGNVITVYYANLTEGFPADSVLINAFNNNAAVYVFLSNVPFGTGTYLVTGVGQGKPPGADGTRAYFTVQAASNNAQYSGSNPDRVTGTYQITLATLNLTTPLPNASVGDQIVITGNSVGGWNSTWTITNLLNSGFLNITATSMVAGVATYTWSLVNGVGPTAGQLITIVQTLNGNGIFNVTDAAIATVTGTTSGTFTINGFPSTNISSAPESGQAQTSGTQFQFEPGLKTLGTTNSPIFGTGNGGIVTVVGSNQQIGAGTRQAVCFFETRNGLKTKCSIPITFTTNAAASYIYATNVPIGPPNVIRRWIAFTVAGANGQPGPNFYTIDAPVSYSINNQNYLYSATYIDDNVTTTAKFTFTDAILNAGEEIDVQGNNLFAQVELGSSAWGITYAQRLFVGGEQNKVQNFNNLSFNGGYLPNPVGNLVPLAWSIDANSNVTAGNPVNITAFQITSNIVTFQATNSFFVGQNVFVSGLTVGTFLNDVSLVVISSGLSSSQFEVAFIHANVGLTSDTGQAFPVQEGATLLPSPVFGNSYYISNQTASTQSTLGMIVQTAYQDTNNIPIINPNTLYSVRITARCPSGNTNGNLVVDLTDYNVGFINGSSPTGYGGGYGTFTVPFSSMDSTMQIFTGTLLTNPFNQAGGVPSGVLLRVYAQNIAYGADVEIDRLEIFETNNPVNTTIVRVSYTDNFEAFDGVTGTLGLAAHSSNAVMGAFEMYDTLYLLQTTSMQSTQDVPGVEPNGPGGGWGLHEVSNRVGTCGINAYDYGEEWMVTACRNGFYGFNGSQPMRIDFQQKEIWELINWNAANTICVRNDLPNRKMYVAIPLPTPNKWMPLAPSNPNPTSPNVVMLFDYQGLGDFNELVTGQGLHTTMFGTIVCTDMRLKCSLWNIVTPYMGFVTAPDTVSQNLLICNGASNSKIYQLSEDQLSDDGVPINSHYATYGFVDPEKAAQLPLLGVHRKRYQGLQLLIDGQGFINVQAFPDYIINPKTLALNPRAYTVGGGVNLQIAPEGEIWRPLNAAGNRVFIVFSGDSVGTSFNLSSMTLVGTIDKFSQVNPNSG